MGASEDDKFVQRLFADYLLEGGVDSAQQYALSGRRFRNLTDAELATAWVDAIKELAKSPFDAERNNEVGDLGHELTFRGIELPTSSVEQEWGVITAAMRQAIDELMSDPARRRQTEDGLKRKLAEFFVQKINREQN